MNEHPLPIEDLEALRAGLQAMLTHFEAVDIANAMKNLSPETQWSSITMLAEDLVTLVNGHIAEFAVSRYESDRDEEVPTVELDLTDAED